MDAAAPDGCHSADASARCHQSGVPLAARPYQRKFWYYRIRAEPGSMTAAAGVPCAAEINKNRWGVQ